MGEEQQRNIQEFLLLSQLNLALCYLRLHQFSHVVDNCNKVSVVCLSAHQWSVCTSVVCLHVKQFIY